MTAPTIGMNQRTLMYVVVMLLLNIYVNPTYAFDADVGTTTDSSLLSDAIQLPSGSDDTALTTHLDSSTDEDADTQYTGDIVTEIKTDIEGDIEDTQDSVLRTEQASMSPAEKLSKQRQLDAQVQFCSPCHGINGVSRLSLYPNLAGKSQEYLLNILLRYKKNGSSTDIMTGMVVPLSDYDLLALANYYAEQSVPTNSMLAAESGQQIEAQSEQPSDQPAASQNETPGKSKEMNP